MNKIKSFLKRNPSRLSQLLKDSQNLELNTSGIQRAVEIQNQLNLLTQNNESSRLRFIQRIKLKKMARIQKNLNGYFNECELNIRLINPLEKALTTRSIKCRQMNKLIDTLFNGMNEINDQLFSKSHSSENVYQILHRADFHYLPSNRLISALIQLLNSPPPLLSPAEGQKWLTVLKENKDKPNLDMTQLIKECEIDNEVKASLIRLCLMMQHLKDIKLVGNVTVEDKFAFPLNYTLNLVEADQQTSNQAQETIDHLKEITRTIMASQFHIPPQSMVSMPLNGAYQSEINHLVPIMTSQIARSSHLNPSTSHLDNNKNSSLHRLN